MRGYFAVDVRDEMSRGPVADYRFLFKSPGVVNSASLADCLEQGLRRALLPDALVFICTPKEIDQLIEVFSRDDGVRQALERASSKVSVSVCEINHKGQIGNPRYIRNERSGLPLIEEESRQHIIFKEGVRRLFEIPNVLCPAPAGFAFVKPSKQRSKYFLRAEAALYETERVHFLAYALLERIAKREDETKESIGVIFIDTMAIASLAYVLRELYHELFQKPKPRVESFHSYGGIKNVPIPRAGTSICIISASSSMAMQNDWRQMTRCFPSEVFTLVTLQNANGSEDAVFSFDKVDLNSRNELSGLRDLRIVGESFIPEEIPLKSVLLTVNAHKNKEWFENGKVYSEFGLFSLMKADRAKDKLRPIFVDGIRLLDHPKFLDYFNKEMMQKVPLSVQAVIYQDDQASKILAEKCVAQMATMKRGEIIPIISANELGDVQLDKLGALLVVAAVIGRGTKLLSISRDLRDIHFGARHYLIGFQLGESIEDRDQLKSNLVFSAVKSSITVSILESLAIGRTVGQTYEVERDLLSKWKGLSDSRRLKDRIDDLSERKEVRNGAFLPATLSGSDQLMLRADFAYWERGYCIKHDHSVAVLLTAAFMLQYAREYRGFKNDAHRLASDTFQQVVLDPENFARYNDGVIQAALLRAAHPSELDYSSSEEISRRMTDMLIGIFKLHTRQQGEAALEFAFALRAGRMKLAKFDWERLLEEVGRYSGSGIYFSLLRDMLDLGDGGAWDKGESI